MDVAEIKEKGFVPELELHVNPGVPVRIIDQLSTVHKDTKIKRRSRDL
jgi:hypothetical protein